MSAGSATTGLAQVRPGAANYPTHSWYAVGLSSEVGPALLARRVLDQPVVVFRTAQGEAVALEDRCAHRQLPLSMGRLVGDELVCRYHGFAYAPSGQCLRAPSQEHPPDGAAVRSYPVREQDRFVWVWTGDPALARAGGPPRVGLGADRDWAVLEGSTSVAANYLLVHENALDRTHFAFVHPDTSHSGYHGPPPPLEVEVTETSVACTRRFPPGPLATWQTATTGLPGTGTYEQHETGAFLGPGLHVDRMRVVDTAPDGRRFESVFVRALTPVDPATTAVHWWVARDHAQQDAAVAEELRRIHERTMAEDQPLLEALQARITRDGAGPTTSAAADVAAVRTAQILGRLLAEERRA